MALEPVDFLQGSFSLIFVIISLVLGFAILSKFPKYKSRLYILVGLSWVGVSLPWWPDSISFLMNIFIGESLAVKWYFIIGNVFIPIALLCWIVAYTDMINKKIQLFAAILTYIFALVFEVTFFILFFIDIDLIGEINPTRPFTVDFGIFITIYLVIVILIMLITGIIFAQKSVRSDDREVRLKGKLLRAAFITFTIAAVLDSSLGALFEDPTDPFLSIMVVIVRLLLITSAIEFYGGFLLPRWMKEIFLRSE
ncbi:MAG: hypothetical protein ACFE9T_00485 [Promethearchaeota archaeon]